MFFTKIICTLLLIQSIQLAFAQDEDYSGPVESLPRFEARRQSSLNAKEDFEYDDDNSASSRGKTNPEPARSGRNDDNNEDDFDENQAPQNGNSGSSSPVNVGPSGIKGQSVSGSGKLGLPRFPSKPDNTFIAPLPVPPRQVAIPAPVAPVTIVGKTNLGSSGSLSGDRSFFPLRPNDATKTVRVVKTARVVRPGPVAVDESEASLANLNGGVKSSQIRPSVTRIVRPVLVQQRPTFVTPVQPVAPSPLPVSIATPITSGSAGPNQIVSGGVKTVQVSGNSNLQPPRLQVVPVTPVAPAVDEDDEDDSASASSGPSRGQLSGVKTVVTNQFAGLSSGRLAPVPRFNPTRTLVQPIRQPAQVIYADQKLTSQDEDDFDGNNGNAVDLSQPDLVKINRPTQVPVRIAPQPYLVPLPSRSFRPESSADISPAVSSNGKVNTIKSTFVARPQPVPTRQTIFTQVAPTPFQPPIAVSSGSASGSKSVSAIKGSGSISPSRFQPRLPSTQRPTPTVNFIDEDGTASNPSGARPVLIRTTGPSPVRPVFTNVQEKINTGSQSVASVQPVLRFNPQPQPQPQQIVQIRDSGASPAELSLPSPPRPVQIVQRVRNTPAPTIRPVTQVTQVRESADFQTVQISQPRLVPVAPSPQPQIRVFEPRPLIQVSQSEDSGLNVFQPLDPSLRPSIPQPSAQGQLSQDREPVAPREVVIRQPAQPQVQVSQVSQVSQVRQVQPSVETVQIRETAVPITSQGNLGVQQISQPRPVDDFQPAPQPFEILRLREPSFPRFSFDQARPQPVISVRPRLVPAALPQSRPVVQISQEKEASLAQQAVQAQVNIIQQQQQEQQQRQQEQQQRQQEQQQRQQEQQQRQQEQQRRQQEQQQLQQRQQEQRQQLQLRQQQQQQQLQQFQQQQQQLQQVKEILNEERRVQIPVAPVAPLVNIESFKTVSQPRPVFKQPVVPRLVAPLPLQPINQISSGSQSSGFPGPVQSRFETVQISQPAPVVTVQQPRPTLVINRPQPAQVIVSNRQPVATVQVQDNSQSAEQIVQIRDTAASIASDFSQIQQVKLARA